MATASPTPEEVQAELARVWQDVAKLAKAPGGKALMQQAADEYEGHEE